MIATTAQAYDASETSVQNSNDGMGDPVLARGPDVPRPISEVYRGGASGGQCAGRCSINWSISSSVL
ncbi:MAG: hypothetical protein HBSAPP02_02880 [Phycisphaerae bacterium]|nr:MAG: hypothetical protein HBSAPP02_02880 [Phycisphaerae bacterium]